MRMRPYIKSKDFEHIAHWVDDERSHALWCANNFPYPITKDAFHSFFGQNCGRMDCHHFCSNR